MCARARSPQSDEKKKTGREKRLNSLKVVAEHALLSSAVGRKEATETKNTPKLELGLNVTLQHQHLDYERDILKKAEAVKKLITRDEDGRNIKVISLLTSLLSNNTNYNKKRNIWFLLALMSFSPRLTLDWC